MLYLGRMLLLRCLGRALGAKLAAYARQEEKHGRPGSGEELMRDRWAAPMWRGLVVALLLVIGGSVAAAPVQTARAAANSYTSSGPTVTIEMRNGTTFAYGATPTPSFTVTATFTTIPANPAPYVFVALDGNYTSGYTNSYAPTASADQLTYTYRVDSNDSQIPVGSHQATARYTDPYTNAAVYSVPTKSFTITKGTPTLNCLIENLTITVSPGQALQIQVEASAANSSISVNGTFSIKFIGPTTVTDSGLLPDSSHLVTVPAPSLIGYYNQVLCIFDGNSSFNPASMNINGQPVLVSDKHQMGGAAFFSNPTTLVAYQPADVYVVFHAGAGLPTPTGYFHINLGNSTTNAVALGPNGDLLLHLDRIPSLVGASQIDVVYQGDPHYDAATFHFPLTNPAIPGGISGSGGGGAQGKATATASATGTPGATATAGDGAVPTAATSSNAALASQPGNGGLLWLWAALGVLVLGGGGAAGAVYFVRRSRRAASSAVGMGVLDGERPRAGVGGNLDGVNRFGSGGGWGDGQG